MSPGRLLYLAYHWPREVLENTIDVALLARRDRLMRAAAAKLPSATTRIHPAPALPPVRFLTGERFAHQTVFCARSLEQAAGRTFRFEFFDDGSLATEQAALLMRLFPTSEVIPAAVSTATVERSLPASRFPALHHARTCSHLMRKLLDLHAGRRGPSLYLDSDMLFFREPTELLAWLGSPSTPLYMAENAGGAYVDSPAILSSLWNATIPSGVNTGIVALNDAKIDWLALEAAAATLGPERRGHKWAEQSLFAWLFGKLGGHPLDASRYRVCYSRADLREPIPVVRHYVHKAKMPYLAGEWRGVQRS